MEITFWAMAAAYYPFMVAYLTDMGYSSTAIGALLSVNSAVVIFAQPIWGMLSDRFQSIRKVYLISLGVTVAFMLLFPHIAATRLIIWVFPLLTAFECAMMPLLDSWVVQGTSKNRISYGVVRLWGSVGFAILAVITGVLVEKYSTGIIFYIYAGFAILVFLSTFIIKADTTAKNAHKPKLSPGRLFKNYHFMAFTISMVIVFISTKAAYTYIPQLLMSVGGSGSDLGLTSSLMAIIEVPFFIIGPWLKKKFKSEQLIIMACFLYLIRQFLLSFAVLPWHVIVIQMLSGPAVAFYMTGVVYYIFSLAPDDLKATAQTLYSSIVVGVGGIIGSLAGGFIIDNAGIDVMYRYSALVTLIGILLFLISIWIGKKLKIKEPVNI